jgi:hypothetical protein
MDNPALRWFWVEMAMEEKQHAGMLQHCREAGFIAGTLPNGDQIERIGKMMGAQWIPMRNQVEEGRSFRFGMSLKSAGFSVQSCAS